MFKNITEKEWNAIYHGDLSAFGKIDRYEWLKIFERKDMLNLFDIYDAANRVYLREDARGMLVEHGHFDEALRDAIENDILDQVVTVFQKCENIEIGSNDTWEYAIEKWQENTEEGFYD